MDHVRSRLHCKVAASRQAVGHGTSTLRRLVRARRPWPQPAAAPSHPVAALGVPVQRGVLGACMQVELVNDGPVTLVLDVEPFARRVTKAGREGLASLMPSGPGPSER